MIKFLLEAVARHKVSLSHIFVEFKISPLGRGMERLSSCIKG